MESNKGRGTFLVAGPESLSSLPSPDCWNSLLNSLTAPTQTRELEDFPEIRWLNFSPKDNRNF